MQRLSGYWQQFLGVVNTSQGEGGGIEEKILALPLLMRSPKCYTLLHTLFPLPSGRTLQSLLNTVQFRTGINTHVFYALRHSMQKMSEKTGTVVSYLTKFRLERMSGLIRMP